MNRKTSARIVTALLIFALGFVPEKTIQAQPEQPLQLGIAGLVHGHVNGFLNRNDDRDDIDIVGVYEPSQELIEKYAARYNLDESIFFTDLEEMLQSANPEAVAIFSSTYDHKDIVEVCAGAGI
ncbi:MAG: gfo/Idh/MocA family oxidoreductase, partial [Candidatus Marinimicrobia bacterium]|nr:gfo/Idh/MocA family oxidoreductase [Candidatus Neomarinimicrobiota bacterium]